MIPRVIGVAKIIDVIEKPYFFNTLKIKLVIPTENKTEKKYEYPIKCTDDDC